MKDLTNKELSIISGGLDGIGSCPAPKSLTDHAQDGYNVGAAIGKVFGYLGAAWDSAKW